MRIVLSILILALVISSCADEPSNEYGSIDVFLTAENVSAEQINVEISAIKLTHISSDGNKTQIDIDTYQPHKYNLSELSNGKNSFLASTKIAPGTLSEIIIVLGENSIVNPQGTFDLKSVNQQGSEIVIKIDENLVYENNKAIFLDFDVQKSISENNGTYYLDPAIRAFSGESTGEIGGVVTPINLNPAISIVMDGEIIQTNTDADGSFCILGLVEGNYDVVFTPVAPFLVKTVSNVSVKANENTDLGSIELEKKIFATVKGDLNINPATSVENRFEMQTPSGLIDMDVIYAVGDTYTYSGTASEIKIMPKASGRTLNIEGVDVVLDVNSRYTITSTDAEITVELRNTKNGNGNWWINIIGENITMMPDPLTSK